MTRERCCELAGDPELLFADGFDDALIGVARWFANTVALYDYAACVAILMDRDGMTDEDAVDFLEYNTLGAWVGDKTPAFAVFDPVKHRTLCAAARRGACEREPKRSRSDPRRTGRAPGARQQ